MKYKKIFPMFFILLFTKIQTTYAQPYGINISFNNTNNWSDNVTLMVIITLLSLSPAIIMTMTPFPRFIVVLSFLRQSLGLQGTPPNQVLVGLAFFMTIFSMNPTLNNIYNNAYKPYQEQKISSKEMLDKMNIEIKQYMIKHTEEKGLVMLSKYAKINELPKNKVDLPLTVIIPSYILSELKRGFIMGFLLYLIFMGIDIMVSTILMSMGMMMLPPLTISLPIKILVFTLANGWYIVVENLIKSAIK